MEQQVLIFRRENEELRRQISEVTTRFVQGGQEKLEECRRQLEDCRMQLEDCRRQLGARE